MKRFLLSVLGLLACAILARAGAIRSISVNVSLDRGGNAHITEIWDIYADEGTEWYLTRENLAGMTIRDFRVSENGVVFEDVGEWNVNRSLKEKAGKSGMVHKRKGVELCWGLGSMGDHIFTVSYMLTGAVRTLRDYDMLHLQLVNPGLSSRPEKVTVKISAEGVPLSSDNCRIWGFGFEGDSAMEDGQAVYRSTARFRRESSVIALLRFDKGIFYSPISVDKDFNDVLETALEGSSYDKKTALGKDDDEEDGWMVFLGMICGMLFSIGLVVIGVRASYRSLLGVPSMRQIDWQRDVPYGGDVLEGEFIWRRLKASASQDSPLAGAMILRMVERGLLIVGRDPDDKVDFRFASNPSFEGLPGCYEELWKMMKEASGGDEILQDREFSRWSKGHIRRVSKWCTAINSDSISRLTSDGYAIKGTGFATGSLKYTDKGKEEARKLVGFRKFLKDFTLSNERTTRDVGLWNDYLVFAMLFGLADKVAKELADIDPQVFKETVYADPMTARQIIWMTNRMGYAITNASASAQMKAASSGFGGSVSFGGGGGFSGGGFGGGAR